MVIPPAKSIVWSYDFPETIESIPLKHIRLRSSSRAVGDAIPIQGRSKHSCVVCGQRFGRKRYAHEAASL